MDETLPPEGKTVSSLMIPTNYQYCEQMGDKSEAYLGEKKRIEEAVINAIAELYPDIRDKLEVIDVVTPLTFVCYTGN